MLRLECTTDTFRPVSFDHVRWLDWDRDFTRAQAFWPSDKPLTRDIWDGARDEGYTYCAIVLDGQVVSMAARYCYADDEWMVAAVGTHAEFRRRGFGQKVVSFITADILDTGRLATCFTAEDNVAMIRTAESVGFGVIVPESS